MAQACRAARVSAWLNAIVQASSDGVASGKLGGSSGARTARTPSRGSSRGAPRSYRVATVASRSAAVSVRRVADRALRHRAQAVLAQEGNEAGEKTLDGLAGGVAGLYVRAQQPGPDRALVVRLVAGYRSATVEAAVPGRVGGQAPQ